MRNKIGKITAGISIVAIAVFSGAAASESVRNELITTRSAVPVEEGSAEVELGMIYTKANSGKRGAWGNNWSRSRRESFRMYEWTLGATIGIAPGTDVKIKTGWVDLYDRQWGEAFTGGSGHHGRGIDDLTVSLKHQFYEAEDASIAYLPGLTIPSGRHSNEGRRRFGPGQNYWSLDQRLAVTKDFNELVVSADIGYSLPFGRTRSGYERNWGESTRYSTAPRRDKNSGERGVLDANVGAVCTAGVVRPLLELNYAHRWISRGNDSDQLHTTIGGIIEVEPGMPRLKIGYQHPVAGRNAARTRRLLLSVAHSF